MSPTLLGGRSEGLKLTKPSTTLRKLKINLVDIHL